MVVGSPTADAQSYGLNGQQPGMPSGALTGSRAQGGLDQIACPLASTCFAVGSYFDSAGQQPLLEQGNPKHLTPVSLSLPTGGVVGVLTSVACSSTTSCVAVGYYEDTSGGVTAALLYQLSSGSWTSQNVPDLDGNPVYDLSAVACSSSAAVGCVATDESQYLVDQVAGVWTTSAIPPPPAGGGNFSAIGCDDNACTLVGYAYLGGDPGNYASVPIATTGVGTSWSTVDAVLPHNADTNAVPGNSSTFGAISCSTTTCEAVGNYRTKSFESFGLFEKITTDGTAPTTEQSQAAPQAPGATDTYLYLLSCLSPKSCTAGGELYTGSSFETVIDTLSAGHVTASVAPGFGINGGDLSCARTVCLAVDSNVGAIVGSQSSWTQVAPGLPAGGSNATLQGTACAMASAADCWAVGQFENAKGGLSPLIEILTAEGS
jgi:hypothetical protein